MNFNPLQMMMQMGQKQQSKIQNPPIDPQRFYQMAPKLTKENLVQLAQQARAHGVALPGATATQTSASTTDVRTVNFFKNCPSTSFLLCHK